MDARVFPDADALSRGAFEELLRTMQEALDKRGRFAIALAGGHTPAKLYALWARGGKRGVEIPWDRVYLFWSDERYVPQNDSLSNYRMVRETLIDHVPVPAENVHPMPTDYPDPEKAARAYESEMRQFFGSGAPAFDLQLLGLGTEGHTASLFPGSPALDENQRWVAAVEVPAAPPRRLTLTPVVLNEGRKTIFMVDGQKKREIIHALREEPSSSSRYPVSHVQPTGGVLWLLDEAAAN
jgi:6-phosphogluconolactonase